MGDDFLSFEDVLKELKLEESELKRMVSWGELRAYQNEDKIRFKKDEIMNIKQNGSGGGDDFLSFEDVLRELKVSENELNKMISEGEIRAFRSEDKIKFKKNEIDGMRKEHITEPTVAIPSEQEELLPAEPELPPIEEDPILLEEDAGNVTTPIGLPSDSIPTIVDEVSLVEETVTEEIAEPVIEEAPKAPVFKASSASKSSQSARASSISKVSKKPSRIQVEITQVKVVPVSPLLMALLGAIIFLMVFVGSFFADSARIMSGTSSTPLGLTREIGQIVVDIFGIGIKL
jgi:hypothetical protein